MKGEDQKQNQEWQDVTLITPEGMNVFVRLSREQREKIEKYREEHPEATLWEAAMETKKR